MKYPTNKSIIYEQLKKEIISGILKPGEIVNEAEISKKYGVGRMPTREALLLLSHQNYVEALPRVGYIITKPTLKEILDTFQVRILLEVEAIGFAVERINNEDIKRLKENNLIENSICNQENGNSLYNKAFELNREFHLTIANISGNSRLALIIENILDDMGRMLAFDPYIADPNQHQKLISCLEQHDKQRAQEAMRRHIDDTRMRILRLY